MRALFSFQWLLTTLGMFEVQVSAEEYAQLQQITQHVPPPRESYAFEPIVKEKSYETLRTKSVKPKQRGQRIH